MPFATVAQLLATASITRGYENEDMRHMTSLAEPILDGKAFTGRALVTLPNPTETLYLTPQILHSKELLHGMLFYRIVTLALK